MKTLILIAFAITFAGWVAADESAQEAKAGAKRPNIILAMAILPRTTNRD